MRAFALLSTHKLTRQAHSELGMGMNAKLALQFALRHWYTLGNGGDSAARRDTGGAVVMHHADD